MTPDSFKTNNEFSVCQFFPGDYYEYVCQFVSAEEAVRIFQRCITSLGARFGTTRRVIITDGGDCVNMEWVFEKGMVFPPQSGDTSNY